MAHRKQRYGLTPAQLADMIANQHGECPICFKALNGKGHVDHNHKTKTNRAILCDQCNRGIGCLGEDPERMESAARYVRHWNHQIKT